MMKKFAIAAMLAGSMLAAQPANAAAIALDQWYTFGFAKGVLTSGDSAVPGFNPSAPAAPAPAWTFSLLGLGTLTVVDGYNSGDQYTISNFGSVLGTTSAPVFGLDCGGNVTACLNTAGMSKATFNLGAGSYSLTGTVSSPFAGGAGFFRVSQATAAVPEPATWAMMLIGFGAIGGALRSRRKGVLAAA